MIALALLVIVGSVGFAFFYITTSKQIADSNASATALAQAKATVPTVVQTTPPNVQTATATPQNVQPTPSTSSDPYTHTGVLARNDPLRDNSQGLGWQTGDESE